MQNKVGLTGYFFPEPDSNPAGAGFGMTNPAGARFSN